MLQAGTTRVAMIGVGNTLATDDGIGILAVRIIRERFADERLCCLETERGGMDLLDMLTGFDAAVLVDASLSGQGPPGSFHENILRSPFTPATSRSLHTVDLCGLLAFGEAAGLPLPREITILAVEAADIETFGEGCTPEVQRALPRLVERATTLIQGFLPDAGLVRATEAASHS